jgi:hypothetical protein
MRRLRLGAWARSTLTWAIACAAVVPATLVVALSPAHATTGGGLSFDPPAGLDSYSLSVVSTGVCTDPRGTNLQLRVSGAGFPDDTNVTPNLRAAVYPIDSRTGGYDVSLQDTMRAFASRQSPPATLSGRYVFTLVCRSPFGQADYGSYSGSLMFATPTHYRALTAASTTTPPAAHVTRAPRPSVSASRATPSVATPNAATPKTLPSTSIAPSPEGVSATSLPTSAGAPDRAPGSTSTTALTPGPIDSAKPRPSATSTPTVPSPGTTATASSDTHAAEAEPSPVAATAAGQRRQGRRQIDVVVVLILATLVVVAAMGLVLRRRRLSPLQGPHV